MFAFLIKEFVLVFRDSNLIIDYFSPKFDLFFYYYSLILA